MKKVLIHSIAFSPDGVSTAYLYNDIALHLKNNGYDVSVLTTTPHYNVLTSELNRQPLISKCFGIYKRSIFKGIQVTHIPQRKFKSALLRMIGFVYWHLLAVFIGVFGKKVDLIISPSPPLTIGLVNLIIAKFRGSKIIYNVQEIYPDLLIEQGGLKSKFIINFLKKMEYTVYNKSDAVTTIDKDFYDTIVSRFKESKKLHIIPNFVDTVLYHPQDVNTQLLEKCGFLENNRLKIMYAGNIGYAQDWETLLTLSAELLDFSVDFYVIGEGVQKQYLQSVIEKRKISNIKILPYQNREMMPQLIAYSDLQFIFMDKKTEGHGFPSKVYTIMACAKPLLVSSGNNTPLHSFLNGKGCAYIDSQEDLTNKIQSLANFIRSIDRDKLKEMGEKGFQIIEGNYSSLKVCKDYENLILNLLSNED